MDHNKNSGRCLLMYLVVISTSHCIKSLYYRAQFVKDSWKGPTSFSEGPKDPRGPRVPKGPRGPKRP